MAFSQAALALSSSGLAPPLALKGESYARYTLAVCADGTAPRSLVLPPTSGIPRRPPTDGRPRRATAQQPARRGGHGVPGLRRSFRELVGDVFERHLAGIRPRRRSDDVQRNRIELD